MKIPIEWKEILEKNPEIKEMLLEQESMDSYGEEMFNRLKMIYDVTADNFENEDGSVNAYFNLWKYGYKPFFVSNELLVLTY